MPALENVGQRLYREDVDFESPPGLCIAPLSSDVRPALRRETALGWSDSSRIRTRVRGTLDRCMHRDRPFY
jgi:hypothetical protein